MKRIYSLDFLRVVAVAMIVLHHYQQITDSWFGGRYNFRSYGVAVEFFFILSGFLTYKYVESKEITFLSFMKSRVLRLVPLVVITSVVYEILLYAYNGICQTKWLLGNEIYLWGILWNALGIQAGWFLNEPIVNNPTWYVSVLLLCYIIFWFILYVCRKKKALVTYFFVGMVMLGVLVSAFNIDLPFLNLHAARGYYAFFWGLLLAKMLERKVISWKLSALMAVVVLAGLWVLIGNMNVLHSIYFYAMNFLVWPAVLVIFVSKPVRKLLDFKFIGVLGELTYDVYLWHIPMMLAMYVVFKLCSINLNLDYPTCLWTFFAGTFVVGAISHFAIDRPIQKLLKKL